MPSDLFSIGRSGLNTSKKKLSTSSHNISNANTEGYSRQRVETKASRPIEEGNYVLGTGTSIKSIKRMHDKLIEKKLHTALSQEKFHEERVYHLDQVENVFNEVNSEGLNKVLNKFFNSFRELSTQPENDTVRGIVRENAKIVVNDFKRLNDRLNEASQNIDRRLEQSVTDINVTLHNISKLNVKINQMELAGGETGDLRDQRDDAVRVLSEHFKIHTYTDNENRYVISAKGVGTLVTGKAVQELGVGNFKNVETGKRSREIFFDGRPGHPLSNGFKEGKIKGMLNTRNHEISTLQSDIDHFAFELANFTNAIHRRGYINNEIPTDEQGNLLPTKKKVTGINFFKSPKQKSGAAGLIELSDDVKEDINNITVALKPNSPGDNRVALAISKLQHEKVLSDGTSSFEESYLKSIGEIGLITGKEKVDLEQSKGITAQIKSLKQSVSGVSIDEETADMVRFQHAYEASAKVIRTADEMFDAVMGIMR